MTVRHTIRINDVDLSVLTGGTGFPVLLLHGIPANATLWDHVLPLLAESGYYVLAPDLPGYGETRFDSSFSPTLLNIADLLADWLRSMDKGRVWLVGHDIGGGVAQLLATRHPDLVEKLTLTNCIVEDSWPVKDITLLRKLARLGLYPLAARMGLVTSRNAKRVLQSTFGEARLLDEDRLQRTFFDAKVAYPDGRRAFGYHLAALAPSELLEHSPQLKSLPMPTQVLWAENDQFQPWDPIGKRLVELLPEPKVSHLMDAGHFSPLETPKAFTNALISFHSS